MPDDKTVAVRLTASNDLFKKAMLDSQGLVKNLGSTVEGQFKKISTSAQRDLGGAETSAQRLGTRMIGIGAASAALGAGMLVVGFKMASTYEQVGKEVLKVQRYTGLAAEESSKLRFAAQQSGIDVDKLTKGLGLMAKQMANTPERMERLGISTRDAGGHLRSTNDVLLDAADRVSKTSNATERLAIAQAVFGKSGAEMLPLLARGRDGISELSAQAEKYGLVLTQDNLNAVKQSIAAHREFDAAVQGLQVQIGTKFLPIITSATSTLADFIAGNHGAAGSVLLYGGAGLIAAGSIVMITGKVITMGRTFLEATAGMRAWAAANVTTMATVGAALAAAGVVYAVYESGVKSAQGAQEKLNASVLETVQKGSFSDLTAEIDKQTAAAERWKQKSGDGAGMGDFFLWDRASAEGKMKAANEMVDKLGHYKELTEAVSNATGISTDSALKWIYAEEAAGHTFDTTGEAVSAFTGKVDTSGMTATQAADAYKAQQEALKQLNDELHASVDPLFGMYRALRDNSDAQRAVTDAQLAAFLAQRDYNEQVRIHGENSSQAIEASQKLDETQRNLADANIKAATSALDVTTAANTLKFAMDNGSLSVQGAQDQLATWVQQGLLTKEQSDAIGVSFGWVAQKADDLNSKSVDAGPVTATGLDDVVTRFQHLLDLIRLAGGAAEQFSPGVGNVVPGPFAKQERASGGPVLAGQTYRVAEMGAELYGSAKGMSLLTGPYFTPQDSGWIYTAAQTSRLMNGSAATVVAGGGPTVNLVINAASGADEQRIRSVLMDSLPEVRRELRELDRSGI